VNGGKMQQIPFSPQQCMNEGKIRLAGVGNRLWFCNQPDTVSCSHKFFRLGNSFVCKGSPLYAEGKKPALAEEKK
jgi:hypothetical protein